MAFLEEFDCISIQTDDDCFLKQTPDGSHYKVGGKRTIPQMLDSAEKHWMQAEVEIAKQRRNESEAVTARQKAEKSLQDNKTIEDLKKQLEEVINKHTSKENKLLSLCFISAIPFYIMTYAVMYMYIFNGMPNTILGKFIFLGAGFFFILLTSFVTAAFVAPLLMGDNND